MNKSKLIGTMLVTGVFAAPAVSLADPPSWANNRHDDEHSRRQSAQQWHHQDDDRSDYRDDDRGDHHHRHRHGYRYQREVRVVHQPTWTRRVVVSEFKPGWYLRAQVGQRLPDDFYRYGYNLPRDARVRHLQSGVTELIVADQIIRILDATQTIVNVTR